MSSVDSLGCLWSISQEMRAFLRMSLYLIRVVPLAVNFFSAHWYFEQHYFNTCNLVSFEEIFACDEVVPIDVRK